MGLGRRRRRRVDRTDDWEQLELLCAWDEQREYEKIRPLVLFGSPPAKRRVLPASLRRLIVDLKAEHPALNLNEIARICYVRTGRRPHLATVRAVLEEEPLPIKAFRRFEPYHEIPEGRERRRAVVALHYGGWPDKSIARYLGVDRCTSSRTREPNDSTNGFCHGEPGSMKLRPAAL